VKRPGGSFKAVRARGKDAEDEQDLASAGRMNHVANSERKK
jgi:hypothetical protein